MGKVDACCLFPDISSGYPVIYGLPYVIPDINIGPSLSMSQEIIPLGTPLDGLATPSCDSRLMPALSRMCSVPPATPENITDQQLLTLLPTKSFFEEAIEAPGPPVDAGTGFEQPPRPESPSLAGVPGLEANTSISERDEGKQRRIHISKEEKETVRPTPWKKGPSNTMSSIYPRQSATTMDFMRQKKRGRRPKKQPEDHGNQEELDDDDLPRDPRRRRILERNRIAATKCRLRKRDEASALASREQAMEDQNRYLSMCLDSLTAEVYHLKTQLLRHADCDCVLIQKYIAHEAKKSVNNMLDMPSNFDRDSMNPGCHGSSGASSSESIITSPDADNTQTPWAYSFRPAPLLVSDTQVDLLSQDLKGHEELPMAPGDTCQMPSLPMAGAQLEDCGNEFLPGLGPHQQPAEEILWDPSWDTR